MIKKRTACGKGFLKTMPQAHPVSLITYYLKSYKRFWKR